MFSERTQAVESCFLIWIFLSLPFWQQTMHIGEAECWRGHSMSGLIDKT